MRLIDADALKARFDGSNETFTAGFVRQYLRSAPTMNCSTCIFWDGDPDGSGVYIAEDSRRNCLDQAAGVVKRAEAAEAALAEFKERTYDEVQKLQDKLVAAEDARQNCLDQASIVVQRAESAEAEVEWKKICLDESMAHGRELLKRAEAAEAKVEELRKFIEEGCRSEEKRD